VDLGNLGQAFSILSGFFRDKIFLRDKIGKADLVIGGSGNLVLSRRIMQILHLPLFIAYTRTIGYFGITVVASTVARETNQRHHF
jgi:hypothetical protein